MSDTGYRPIVVPELGLPEGASLRVSFWLFDVGDEVVEGDRVVELLAADFTFDVPASATGRLVSATAKANDRVAPGAVLGYVEAAAERWA